MLKLVSNLFRSRNKPARRHICMKRRRGSFRPRIDLLEDRLAPAMLLVNTHMDLATSSPGVLSLREAITQANSAKTPARLCSAGVRMLQA
jgi:hypothetical protein